MVGLFNTVQYSSIHAYMGLGRYPGILKVYSNFSTQESSLTLWNTMQIEGDWRVYIPEQ